MSSLRLPLASNMSFRFDTKKKSPVLSTTPSNLNFSSISRFHLQRKQKCVISATDNEKNPTEMLEPELEPEQIPKHVAVIMDGNRRWAKSRELPPLDGFIAGGKAFEQLVLSCLKYGVKVLTVFAFSTENWSRPKGVLSLMNDLFTGVFVNIINKFLQNEVRLSFMGKREKLSEPIQELMSILEETTKGHQKLHIVMAFNYSGRYDMAEATKKIASKVKHGVLHVEDIDDAVFEQHLATNVIDEFPNPDLLIRSSGELRLSNFMLWQLAYTELFFTDKLFPEFDETDFMEAIAAFQRRQRRFGGETH